MTFKELIKTKLMRWLNFFSESLMKEDKTMEEICEENLDVTNEDFFDLCSELLSKIALDMITDAKRDGEDMCAETAVNIIMTYLCDETLEKLVKQLN